MAYNKEQQFDLLIDDGKEGLLSDHYELALRHPQYDSKDWRRLLQDPEVSLYIAQEFKMIREAEIRKLQASASDSSKSVGSAQMINAMVSASEKESSKREGPIFVYTYVPPSEQQLKADNVRVIDYQEAVDLGIRPKEKPVEKVGIIKPEIEGGFNPWKT